MTVATTFPTPDSLVTRADLRIEPVTFDLYRAIHKGLRAELFAVTGLAGRVDTSDPVAVGAVSERVRSLAELLELHAHHEDAAIDPVLADVRPDLAEVINTDHQRFERRIYGVVAVAEEAASIGGAADQAVLELHLGLAAFTGCYLGHIDLEERVVMPALERAVGIDGVMAIHGAIVGPMPPDVLARSLVVMVPAMTPAERAELLGGIRAGAPAEAFAGVLDLACSVLSPADAIRLRRDLGEA